MNLAGAKILVVDDEQGLRDLLSYELGAKGYKISLASNGAEAVQKLKDDPVDVIVTDIVMPNMDGLALLRKAKEIDPDVEVIVVTGFATIETAVEAMKNGAYDYVQKPYSVDQMELAVNRAVEKRRMKYEMSELTVARDAALEASRAKSEFLATMSHEIRTPMNAIVGMAELLSETPLDSNQKKFIDILRSGGDTLLNLINDILDLSKVESGRLELEEASFPIHEFLERTAEFMAVRAHEKNLELVCHMAPDVPPFVIGDSNRLRQVLVNLIGNAIKFTEKGEVVIFVKKDGMEGEGPKKKCKLRFTVKDTGIGVPDNKREMIFDRFTQADTSTTRRYGGTGLGLSISKKLIELMGGKIWVESQLGKGSSFHFTVSMPLGVQPAQQQKVMADLKGLKTLIVDDNSTNRLILKEALTAWGVQATEVDGGKACMNELNQAKKKGEPYELVLLDCRMPEMDGFDVAHEVNLDKGLANTVVMMLTSDARNGDINRSKALGMIAYLVKPIKRSELFDILLKAMNSAKTLPKDKRPLITPSREFAGKKFKILLVEDSAYNRFLIEAYLEKMPGYQIDSAVNGKEAVDKFKTSPYDLVLMDMQMPTMDGNEATQEIRKISTSTPIIALSANVMAEDIKKSHEAGCDEYLIKPIKKDVLVQALEKYSGIMK